VARRGLVPAVPLARAVAFVLLRPASSAASPSTARTSRLARVERGQFDDSSRSAAGDAAAHDLRRHRVGRSGRGDPRRGRRPRRARSAAGRAVQHSLQLDLISREAQITEQLNNLRGLELAQAQSRLVHERELVEVRYQLKR
jgi:HlyD family secretion protein